jgi:hypothetical protein
VTRADYLRIVRRAWDRHARVQPHPQGEMLMTHEGFVAAAAEVLLESVEKFLDPTEVRAGLARRKP